MFYYIASKLPMLSGMTDDSKYFKIFLTGSICYIILHALLFSNICTNLEIIQNYKHYIYYLWAIDSIFTGGSLKFMSDNSDDNDNSTESGDQNENAVQQYTRDEILQKIAEARLKDIEHQQQQIFVQKQQQQVESHSERNPERNPEPKQKLSENENLSRQKSDNIIQEQIIDSDTEFPLYSKE